MEMDTLQVRVALKIRPAAIQTNPDNQTQKICIQLVPNEPQIIIGREEAKAKKSFTFDYIINSNTSQEDIYCKLAAPLISQFLRGFNATILAYGQTFSGKTYTMGLNNNEYTVADQVGIIPRVFEDIFSNLVCEDGTENQLKISFLEIYQEQIRDLLVPEQTNKEISIRETKEGSIILSNITEKIVSSSKEMIEYLRCGALLRSTGDTQMHQQSSRSHAIITITLDKISYINHTTSLQPSKIEPVLVQRSKLSLVDLAGSERLKRTGAEGIRLKESVKINSGLLALGNVISILGGDKQDQGNKIHVPYRDSKLTRLLQDSLGGSSQTLMLACISPLDSDLEETINTLKYADRARKIQNKPVINVIDHNMAEQNRLRQTIELLELKLKGFEGQCQDPIKLLSHGIDFGDNEWMQYFIDQLKDRTIRGTSKIHLLDAIKSLEKVTRDNCGLNQRIKELECALEASEQKSLGLEKGINDESRTSVQDEKDSKIQSNDRISISMARQGNNQKFLSSVKLPSIHSRANIGDNKSAIVKASEIYNNKPFQNSKQGELSDSINSKLFSKTVNEGEKDRQQLMDRIKVLEKELKNLANSGVKITADQIDADERATLTNKNNEQKIRSLESDVQKYKLQEIKLIKTMKSQLANEKKYQHEIDRLNGVLKNNQDEIKINRSTLTNVDIVKTKEMCDIINKDQLGEGETRAVNLDPHAKEIEPLSNFVRDHPDIHEDFPLRLSNIAICNSHLHPDIKHDLFGSKSLSAENTVALYRSSKFFDEQYNSSINSFEWNESEYKDLLKTFNDTRSIPSVISILKTPIPDNVKKEFYCCLQKIVELEDQIRVVALDTESELNSKTKGAIVPIAENLSGLRDLEKEIFYYRNANKGLKSKLREVVAVNHRLAKGLKDKPKIGNVIDLSIPVAV